MRKTIVILSAAFFLFAGFIPAASATNVDLGISMGSEGIRGFYLGVSNYFRVPEREVIHVRERGIHYNDLPVVFFMAARAHVAPGVIADLRLGGMNWWDISVRYGIGPEVYYVPVPVVVKGPPYGKAYGHYKKHPRHQWNQIVLQDADIVNMVNLRYVSEYYDYPENRVMKMRGQGKDFVAIDWAAAKESKGKKNRYAMDDGKYGKKGKHGKEVKKDKGKGGDRSYGDDARGKGGKPGDWKEPPGRDHGKDKGKDKWD
ncbi:MAG TPA: hypothetical protein PLR20_10715 [Syntrophales bacterium]|nr:hypothetical protein [Syntrophales bacterium]HPI57523.1 hypothetical protein [Syntrophales bacterium]HPN24680.1 hypothetical protein [Syntrophales bacterium]HQM29811.1 hypothetical protein [Syntrophales bacterium]